MSELVRSVRFVKKELAALREVLTKYLATWVMLLLHPREFLSLTIERRRSEYTPPWQFVCLSVPVLALLAFPAHRVFENALDPVDAIGMRVPIKNAFDTPYDFGVQLMVSAVFWYLALVRWMKAPFRIRTSAPFWRVLVDMMYLRAGPSLLLIVVIGSANFLAFAAMVRLISRIQSIHQVGNLRYLIIALAAELLLGIVGVVVIGVYYDLVLVTTMFKVKRTTATCLCIVLALASTVSLILLKLPGAVVLPWQLNNAEREAAAAVISVSRLESAFKNAYGAYLDFDGLVSIFSAAKPAIEKDAWYQSDLVNLRRVSGSLADGYKFSVVRESAITLVRAEPYSYGHSGRYSFIAIFSTDPDSALQAYGADHRGGAATVRDQWLLPPAVLRYK